MTRNEFRNIVRSKYRSEHDYFWTAEIGGRVCNFFRHRFAGSPVPKNAFFQHMKMARHGINIIRNGECLEGDDWVSREIIIAQVRNALAYAKGAR